MRIYVLLSVIFTDYIFRIRKSPEKNLWISGIFHQTPPIQNEKIAIERLSALIFGVDGLT